MKTCPKCGNKLTQTYCQIKDCPTRLQNYYRYMQSNAWRQRSKSVIERDKHCAACPETQHLQAHHWTYDHFGAEPLEDLIALCPYHHDAITDSDRRKRYSTREYKLDNSPVSTLQRGGVKYEKFEFEDYRRVSTVDAQRSDSRSIE